MSAAGDFTVAETRITIRNGCEPSARFNRGTDTQREAFLACCFSGHNDCLRALRHVVQTAPDNGCARYQKIFPGD